MQTVDIIILLIIALPTIAGAIYGFLNIMFSLLAWILALGIAIVFYPEITTLLEPLISDLTLRITLAFIGLFVGNLMLLTGIGFLVTKLLGKTGLTGVSRMLGSLFGIIMGCVIVEIIVFLGGFTELPQESLWNDSKIIKPFERVADWSGKYLPEDISVYHEY